MTPRLVTKDVWAANAVGALVHQKTKAKHLSKPLQAKGLIPNPCPPPSPNFSAPHFADLRGFHADFRLHARGFLAPHATRILKRDNAKFGTKFQTRIFWGTPTYNFQYFWPKKFHTQNISPNFMLFHRHFFDPFYLPSLAPGRSRTRLRGTNPYRAI